MSRALAHLEVRGVRSMTSPRWLTPLIVAMVAARAAAAQETLVDLSAGPLYARPSAALAWYVGTGYGAGAHVTITSSRRLASFRIEADYLRYPATTRSRPFRLGSPAIITTGSGMFLATAGPRLSVPLGSARLEVGGGAGLARLTNTGSVSLGSLPGLNRSTSFDDLTCAAAWGASSAVRVAGEATPVWLEASARRLWVCRARWLREGNLPTGTISGAYLNPTWSAASMWVYRLSVGVELAR